MDFNNLKDTISGLSLYDVKAGVRKVQNAMMNYTEMEAKVREATNNEPWGASSTLMQDIANGTYNYQTLNEIMPMIYKRFTEKAAEEWRQIYKALQLLEFLIKNGSERVIDDARSHISLLKMLRQFHFIDQNGKDQGINVRNRAKELADLLGDSDRIRAERKKSKQTRNKYGGVEGGSSFAGGFSSGSSSRYGGFGSESGGGYGGFSGGVYGDGGGFGGEDREAHTDLGGGGSFSQRKRDQFEEYDEFDDGAAPSKASSSARKSTTTTAPPKKEPPKQKAVDLFSFDDEPSTTAAAPAALTSPPAQQKAAASLDDDDFDDFQSAAPPAAPQAAPARLPTDTSAATLNFAAPQPVSAPQAANLSGLVALNSISPAQNPLSGSAFTAPAQPMQQPVAPLGGVGYQAAQPNYYTSVPTAAAAQANTSFGNPANKPTASSTTSGAAKPAGSAFGSLWNQASSGEKKVATPTTGPKLSSLAKEKASAGIWGTTSSGTSTPAASTPGAQKPAGGQQLGNGLDDLLG